MESYVKDLKFFLGRTADEGPPLDMYESEECLVLEFDLPGIDTDQVSVEIVDDTLIIEGNKMGTENENKDLRYVCMERSRNCFHREVSIPVAISAEEGKAEYKHGVLKIVFPKARQCSVKIRIEKKENS